MSIKHMADIILIKTDYIITLQYNYLHIFTHAIVLRLKANILAKLFNDLGFYLGNIWVFSTFFVNLWVDIK